MLTFSHEPPDPLSLICNNMSLLVKSPVVQNLPRFCLLIYVLPILIHQSQ